MKASRKWIMQRASALIVAPLIVWFLLSLITLSTGDYNSVINFFSKPIFNLNYNFTYNRFFSCKNWIK